METILEKPLPILMIVALINGLPARHDHQQPDVIFVKQYHGQSY